MSTLLYSPKTPTSMIVSSPTLADRSYRDMYMQSYQTRPQPKQPFTSPTVPTNIYPGTNLRLNTSISNTSHNNNNDSNYLLSTETDPMFKTNQLLKKSNYDLLTQLKQYETEPIITTSNSHIDNITSNTPARYQNTEVRQYNDKLRAELAVSTQKNSELITMNDNILRKTEEAINYNTALKGELNQLEEDIKSEISANNELKSKYNDILKRYTSEYQDKQKNISALQAQNEKAIAQNAQLQRENERLRSDISQYENLISNFKHTIQQLSNTEIVDKYENEIKSRLQDKEKELNEKDDYIQSLNEKNELLRQEIKNKQMQLNQIKESLSQKENELPNIYELQRELDNYDERIKTLNEISNQKEMTIKHLEQSYDTLYSALYKNKNGNEDYESKYLEEKENNEMLEKKINELNVLAKGVADSREEMKSKYEEAILKLNNAVKQLDEMNQKGIPMNENVSSNGDIKKQIEMIEQENKLLKEKNIMIMGKMEKLPEIEKKFEEIVKENEQLIKDNAELMKEVQEYKEIDEQYEGIENAENGGDYEEGEEMKNEEQKNQIEEINTNNLNNNNDINDDINV